MAFCCGTRLARVECLQKDSNRARGERAKREAEPGAPDTADVDVIDVSEYQPPRIPSKKWRELINPPSPRLRRD